MTRRVLLVLPFVVSACASPSLQRIMPRDAPAAVTAGGPISAIPPETLDPDPPPPPPAEARTVDDFDTTTEEDRAEAVAAPASASGTALGTTLATLGSPADPGIWLKTPLVSELAPGRIEYRGASVNVELRPSGGQTGSGSQISLAAMRLIEAPLTEIVELSVFR